MADDVRRFDMVERVVRDTRRDLADFRSTVLARLSTAGGGGGGEGSADHGYVATSQGTTSGTFADLATTGPSATCTVGASGEVLVFISAKIASPSDDGGEVAVAVSGATTVAADADRTILANAVDDVATYTIGAGTSYVHTGLNEGSTTFTMKYRRSTGSGTINFSDRQIVVIPIEDLAGQGPQGDTGPEGPQGPAGEDGEDGVTDHGALTGLADNDHPQYSLTTHDHDADYAALSHAHAAADTTSGTFAIGRIPTGTTSSTVSLGDHAHAGTYQPLDSDLTTIAGLTATTDNFIQSKSSAWASRTPTQVAADLVSPLSSSFYTQDDIDSAFADRATYLMSEYGLITASIHVDNVASTTANAISQYGITVYRVLVPASVTITGACCYIGTAGVTPGASGDSGFKLYTDAGAAAASHTTDYTIFTSTGWRSKDFTTPVVVGSSPTWYRIAMMHTCSTTPRFAMMTSAGAAFYNSHRSGSSHTRARFQSNGAATTFPASITPASYGANDAPIALVGLY